MKFLFSSTLFLCLVWSEVIFAQATFQKAYGGSGNETVYAIDTTWDGKYVMFSSTSSSGNGSDDYLLQKADKNGNVVWAYTYGGAQSDLCLKGTATSDSGFVMAGRTASFGNGGTDVWIVKTDSLGNVQWSQTYGGAYDESLGFAIRETLDGGYIIGAGTKSYGTNNSYGDVYVIKIDKTGNVQWNYVFGNVGDDWVTDILVTPNGYILVGSMEMGDGTHNGLIFEMDQTGTILWNSTYGCSGTNEGFYGIIPAYNGGWVLAGSSRCVSYNEPDPDAWVIRLASDGTKIWEKSLRGTDADGFYSVTRASSGYGYVLSGITKSTGAGNADGLMTQVDTSGNVVWTQLYGGTANDNLFMIKTIPGGYIASGYTSSSGGGANDNYLIKTDLQGKTYNSCSNTLLSSAISSGYYDNTHAVVSGMLTSSQVVTGTSYLISVASAYYSCCPDPTPTIHGNTSVDCLNNGPASTYYVDDHSASGNTYVWTKKGNINFTTAGNLPQVNTNVTENGGTIIVAETNTCGTAYDSLKIDLTSTITVTSSVIPTDTPCAGTSRTMEIYVNNPTANLIYHWTSSDAFTKDTTKGTIQLKPQSASTKYYLNITDLHTPSCVNIKDTFSLASYISPVITAHVNTPPATCEGTSKTVSVDVNNTSANLLYHWSNEDHSFDKVGTDRTIEINPTQSASTYYLTITEQHSPSCISIQDTFTVFSLTKSAVAATVTAPSDVECVGVPRNISVHLNDTSSTLLYHWSSSDNSFTTTTHQGSVLVTPQTSETTYYLNVEDPTLCIQVNDTIVVLALEKQNLVIPNLITPNNDGKNDQFILKDVNGGHSTYQTFMEVYNGWGELVYQAEHYDNTWEGNHLSNGIYYYAIKSCGNIPYKGWLQIIR